MKFRLAGVGKPIIMVDVKVNGKGPFNFAVDTGASMTVISKPTAEKLGISKNQSTPKKGHSCYGEIDASLDTIESVQVGDTEAKDVQVAITDLSAISKMVGTELEGIIGHSFMKDYRIVIDYPKNTILFEKTQAQKP